MVWKESLTLAAVASLTLFDIALAATSNVSSNKPTMDNTLVYGELRAAPLTNCLPTRTKTGDQETRNDIDTKVITKDEVARLGLRGPFDCADNPTGTIYS
jgi:hypothetical protein